METSIESNVIKPITVDKLSKSSRKTAKKRSKMLPVEPVTDIASVKTKKQTKRKSRTLIKDAYLKRKYLSMMKLKIVDMSSFTDEVSRKFEYNLPYNKMKPNQGFIIEKSVVKAVGKTYMINKIHADARRQLKNKNLRVKSKYLSNGTIRVILCKR